MERKARIEGRRVSLQFPAGHPFQCGRDVVEDGPRLLAPRADLGPARGALILSVCDEHF
jgi:hypothetical protein